MFAFLLQPHGPQSFDLTRLTNFHITPYLSAIVDDTFDVTYTLSPSRSKWIFYSQNSQHEIHLPYTASASYTIMEITGTDQRRYYEVHNNTPMTFFIFDTFWLRISYSYWLRMLKVYTRFHLSQLLPADLKVSYQPAMEINEPFATMTLPQGIELQFSIEYTDFTFFQVPCCILRFDMTFYDKNAERSQGQRQVVVYAATYGGLILNQENAMLSMQSSLVWEKHLTEAQYSWQMPFLHYGQNIYYAIAHQVRFKMHIENVMHSDELEGTSVELQYQIHPLPDWNSHSDQLQFLFYRSGPRTWDEAHSICQNFQMSLPIWSNGAAMEAFYSQYLYALPAVETYQRLGLNLVNPVLIMTGLREDRLKVGFNYLPKVLHSPLSHVYTSQGL